jgi:hypothetical protein
VGDVGDVEDSDFPQAERSSIPLALSAASMSAMDIGERAARESKRRSGNRAVVKLHLWRRFYFNGDDLTRSFRPRQRTISRQNRPPDTHGGGRLATFSRPKQQHNGDSHISTAHHHHGNRRHETSD